MGLQIGDKISVLDKVLKGEIKSITDYKAVIIDEFGFEEEYPLNKIVLVSNEKNYTNTLNNIINKDFKIDKTLSKKNIIREIKEIDLHMENLSGSTNGMTNHEIVVYQLNVVKNTLRNTNNKEYSKIVFVHGIGKGKLRYELEQLLYKKNINFQDASFKKYGRGAIEIIL